MGWIEVGGCTDARGVGSLRKSSDMIRLSGFYIYGKKKAVTNKNDDFFHVFQTYILSLTIGVLKILDAKEPKLPVLDLLCNGRDVCFGCC